MKTGTRQQWERVMSKKAVRFTTLCYWRLAGAVADAGGRKVGQAELSRRFALWS